MSTRSQLRWTELSSHGFKKHVTSIFGSVRGYSIVKPKDVEWPEDGELISWCCGEEDSRKDGFVQIETDREAVVCVYGCGDNS